MEGINRVDAWQKVSGTAKYTSDIGGNMLCAKVLHATIANGWVSQIDTTEAASLPGVIKIVTCFDVPDRTFSTRNHVFIAEPGKSETEEICNRRLLNRRVRFYGDDIAVVVAVDSLTAHRALAKIKVNYQTLPPVLDVFEAMKTDQPPIHEGFPNNIMEHTTHVKGNFDFESSRGGLRRIEGWYSTPIVQHCHLEPISSYAYMEGKRVTVVTGTQIPHILKQLIAEALQLPADDVRIIKPYIGGAFGNREEALYEPLNAYLSM